jgi:hypothetical protein
MGYSKTLCNRKENFCLSENGKKCNETSYLNFIREPFPSVICLNINWFNNEVPYMDTLKFCLSIP